MQIINQKGKMEKELAEILHTVLMDFNTDIIPDYSGRGMLGNETPAISTNASMGDVLGAVIIRANLFIDSDGNEIFNSTDIQVDSMGTGIVIY